MNPSLTKQYDMQKQSPRTTASARFLPDSLTKRKKLFSFLSERNTRTCMATSSNHTTSSSAHTINVTILSTQPATTAETVSPLVQMALDDTDIHFLRKSLSKFQNKIKQRQDILKQSIVPWFQHKQQPPSLTSSATATTTTTTSEANLDQARSILLRWWGTLLSYVQHINHTERSLYFECLLEIMARSEFMLFDQTDSTFDEWYSSVERSTLATRSQPDEYKRLLVSTLRYSIDKLNNKAIYSNMISFCAKILAFGFVKIPGLAASLMQFLPVRNTVMRRLVIEMGDLKCHSEYSTELSSVFPAHLQPMMTSNLTHYKQHIRKTIQRQQSPMPLSGNWIRRWKSDDSELFFSFYRHYHATVKSYIVAGFPSTHKYDLSERNAMLAVSPGYVYLASYFASKIDALLHRRLHSVTTLLQQPQSSSADTNVPNADNPPPIPPDNDRPVAVDAVFLNPGENAISISTSSSILPQQEQQQSRPRPVNLPPQPTGKPQPLEMATLRYAECMVSCVIMADPMGLFHDMINVWIRTMVKTTNMMAVESVFCLLDFIEKAIFEVQRIQHDLSYPLGTNGQHHLIPLDLPFLLYTLRIILLQSDHSITLLRALSFAYAHFDFLVPDSALLYYMCNRILLFTPIFERLFLHWSRNVRIFFARCMLWRVGRVWKTAHVRWPTQSSSSSPSPSTPSSSSYSSSSSIQKDPPSMDNSTSATTTRKVCDGNDCWNVWYHPYGRSSSKRINEQLDYDRCALYVHISLETFLDAFQQRNLELNHHTPQSATTGIPEKLEEDGPPLSSTQHDSLLTPAPAYKPPTVAPPYHLPIDINQSDDKQAAGIRSGDQQQQHHYYPSTTIRRRSSSGFKKQSHLLAHPRTSITTAKKNKWMKLFSFGSFTAPQAPSTTQPDNDDRLFTSTITTTKPIPGFYYTVTDIYTWKAPPCPPSSNKVILKLDETASDDQACGQEDDNSNYTSQTAAHPKINNDTLDTSPTASSFTASAPPLTPPWYYARSNHVYANKAIIEHREILHEYSTWADKISITKMLVQDRDDNGSVLLDPIMDVPGLTLDWPKNWSYSQFG